MRRYARAAGGAGNPGRTSYVCFVGLGTGKGVRAARSYRMHGLMSGASCPHPGHQVTKSRLLTVCAIGVLGQISRT